MPPKLLLPRGLIMLASVWLVVSWVIAIGFGTPVEASSASYTPGVRLMLLCTTIGLMIAWPLMRLSQGRAAYPIRLTLLDLIVLLALLQVVIWPLRLVTPWSPARTAALDATMSAWTVLAGALVASAAGSERAGPRNLAILACAGICVGGPLAAWVILVFTSIEPGGLLVRFGPLLEVHHLAEGGGAQPPPQQWHWIALVAVAAIAAWAGLGTAMMLRPAARLGSEKSI